MHPEHRLPIQIQAQPTETTCGPTCLAAVYRYWGEKDSLAEVVTRIRTLEKGGTFAVFLAVDALRKGYGARIYTYNLMVFDPIWFENEMGEFDIAEKLRLQAAYKNDARLKLVTEGYLEFIERGGELILADLSRRLIRTLLLSGLPIITGLSATFLYRAAREFGPLDCPDDIRGYPAGHFVVIAGYNRDQRSVLIADPFSPHPFGRTREYWISIDRVIGAVLLGVLTHDANLLVIEKESTHAVRRRTRRSQ